jgi:hypothetical protein
MGFLDVLGGALGKAAAIGKEVQAYKSQYESWRDDELKREHSKLKGASGTENKYRLIAVRSVLNDRGYGKS